MHTEIRIFEAIITGHLRVKPAVPTMSTETNRCLPLDKVLLLLVCLFSCCRRRYCCFLFATYLFKNLLSSFLLARFFPGNVCRNFIGRGAGSIPPILHFRKSADRWMQWFYLARAFTTHAQAGEVTMKVTWRQANIF